MTISRRDFMHDVMVASAAIGVSVLPASAWERVSARSAGASTTWRVLTADQGSLLTTVLNRLVPESGVMPAAGDLGVAGFIDEVIAEAPHVKMPVVELLAALHGRRPDACSARPRELDAMIEQLQFDSPESFEVLVRSTYVGYYSHGRVLAALGVLASGAPGSDTSLSVAAPDRD